MSDYGYEQYLADLDDRERRDTLLRFLVLDAAVFVENELLAAAAKYLGGSDATKQEVVDRLIGSWGGRRAAERIIHTALTLNGRREPRTDDLFARVKKLVDLRHLMAHGTTESWQENAPEVRDGRMGRELRTRSRSGEFTITWIDFDEAEATIRDGRQAALELGRCVVDMAQRLDPQA